VLAPAVEECESFSEPRDWFAPTVGQGGFREQATPEVAEPLVVAEHAVALGDLGRSARGVAIAPGGDRMRVPAEGTSYEVHGLVGELALRGLAANPVDLADQRQQPRGGYGRVVTTEPGSGAVDGGGEVAAGDRPVLLEEIRSPSKFTSLGLRRGYRFATVTGGGGGFGEPFERDPNAVLEDVLAGLVEPSEARRIYGVAVFQQEQEWMVDKTTTASLRSKSDRPGGDGAAWTSVVVPADGLGHAGRDVVAARELARAVCSVIGDDPCRTKCPKCRKSLPTQLSDSRSLSAPGPPNYVSSPRSTM
jgi:hypothetical protein